MKRETHRCRKLISEFFCFSPCAFCDFIEAMKYISTRGLAPSVASSEALLNGIAPDGGLYVPAEIPTRDALPDWLEHGCGYAGTMRKLLALFFDDVPAHVRDAAVERSVARFADPAAPVPFRAVAGNVVFMDLAEGPTAAFKDVALTILPTLLQYAAERAGLKKVAILTATSGDTGSAAMRGFAGVAGTEVLVFFPKTGTSEIQRRQMVCCEGANVHACAIEGNFDDAQAAVKAVFADEKIRADAAAKGIFLSSANSINIGRLFPQVCYYLMAWRELAAAGTLGAEGFDVVVPTGNFGNVLAAFYAKKLGAPIRRFVVASNENCVVADFIRTGEYDTRRAFRITNSPSMDILVSSNIERFIFEISGRDSAFLRERMATLKSDGVFSLGEKSSAPAAAGFVSGHASPEETEAAIAAIRRETGYLADPHTAIGWKVLRDLGARGNVPAVVAETAAPWKFPATMLRALTGTCAADDFENLRALGELVGRAPRFSELETAPVLHTRVCAKARVGETVRSVFGF